MGHQGIAAGAVELLDPRVGHEVLEQVVLVGHTLQTQAGDRGGTNDKAPATECDDLLLAPHHQCDVRIH